MSKQSINMNYFNEHTVIFKDGAFVSAKEATTDLYSQTLHYGNGVFEGIRAYDTSDGTRIFKAKEHYDRLQYSARTMHINLPYSSEELEAITYELLHRTNLKDAYIRPWVFIGSKISFKTTHEVHVCLL
jgi:branched-chain amino acid aminotransferase